MLGIIGGTGLYAIEGLDLIEAMEMNTPFGRPSAKLQKGRLGGQELVFLPRHGLNHQFMPSEVNFRANIYALKKAGVTRVIGISAVGSLNPELAMGDLAIPVQYFDWTKGIRAHTFFGEGLVAHVSTAEPSCPRLAEELCSVGLASGINIHNGVTYACVEGPRLGTKAESIFLKDVAGCDVVGMTNLPEAFLAREAQMCYATITIVTDYDCWQDDPKRHASVAEVFKNYGKSIVKVQGLLKKYMARELSEPDCQCRRSLELALITSEGALDAEQKALLKVLKC